MFIGGGAVIEIFYLIFVMLISFVLGQRILKLVGIKFNSLLENAVFSVPLGFAILAYIVLFIGFAGLLYTTVFLIILLVLIMILLKDIRNLVPVFFNLLKKIKIKNFNFFTLLFVFAAFLLFLNFIASFAPPYNFDILTYHLAFPKIYLNEHSIVYIPYLYYSNLPSFVEIIYLSGLLLYNAILANLFAYGLSTILFLAIYSFCKRFFDYRVGIIGALIFYTSPLVIPTVSVTHTDISLALFTFLAIYSLLLYLDYKKNGFLILTAIFVGLTASSKILGGIPVIVISILSIYFIFINTKSDKKINYKAALHKLAVFFLIALMIFMPWMLKVYFHTGNPVWPFFYNIFGGKNWDKEHVKNEALLYKEYKPKYANIVDYLKMIWNLNTPSEIGGGGDFPIRDPGGMGPFLLALLPIYFFLPRKNKNINLLLAIFFALVILWLFVDFFLLRHITYALPLLAIISAYVIVDLFKNKKLEIILKILLLFTFVFGFLIWGGANMKKMPVAFGLETKEEFYLEVGGPLYKASKFINVNLPANSRILLFRENQGYLLDRDYVWADPIYTGTYINYKAMEDEEDLYNRLKEIKITHILVNNNVIEEFEVREYRYSKKILNMTGTLLKKYTVNLYGEDNILINELK